MAQVLNAVNLLDSVFIKPQLLQVNALVQTTDASNLIAAQVELPKHGQAIYLSDRFDFIIVQPHSLQEAALVNAFNLTDSLVDDVQLADVWEMAKPVHSVDVIKAKVNCLYSCQILSVDTKCFALYKEKSRKMSKLEQNLLAVVLTAYSSRCSKVPPRLLC